PRLEGRNRRQVEQRLEELVDLVRDRILQVDSFEVQVDVPSGHRSRLRPLRSPASTNPARRNSAIVFCIDTGCGETVKGRRAGSGGNTIQCPRLVRSMWNPCARASRKRPSSRILRLSPENVNGSPP